MKKITYISWRDGNLNPQEANVGSYVKSITEHSPQVEGDKWYYDIEYPNGNVTRVFEIITVQFE